MPTAKPRNKQQLSRIAELVPAIRGALARPSDVEGRPHRVVLACNEADPEGALLVSSDNPAEISSALADSNGPIYVPELGVLTAGQTRSQAIDILTSQDRPAETVSGDLIGQVAVVTGGAGGLGLAIAGQLRAEGADVALLDINTKAVEDAAAQLKCSGFACDVTDPTAVEATVNEIVAQFGGIDILISNAGAAHQGALMDLPDDDFQKAFAVNFWSHHFVARNVVKVMKKQGTGGALVFNVSKQAVNPGPNFGAYGTPKAALLALMRQYAVEHGADGITSNAVNADRIRTGLMTDRMVQERSKARGLTPEQYMRGNLVKREVTGKDVADAFIHLVKARTSTGAVLTVDGGNVAAMMR